LRISGLIITLCLALPWPLFMLWPTTHNNDKYQAKETQEQLGLGDEAGDGLVGGEGHQEPPVDQDKQKCHATSARIRGALEASNLTPEDLQTLKRLNEIAGSTGLTQEQKQGEAIQLLNNNPKISRLLLKLRTEENIQNP